MAALASIPEGTTSLHHNKSKPQHAIDAHPNSRPKSRVFPAPKRHSKVRYSTRPTSYISTWPHHYDSLDAWTDTTTSGDLTSGPVPASTPSLSANTSRQMHTSDEFTPNLIPDSNYAVARSDASLDLDVFQIPPLRSAKQLAPRHLNPEKTIINEPKHDSTSAIIRTIARAYVSNTKLRDGSPCKSINSHASRCQHVDGAHDSYSSSHHSSVDSALVDAISRNVMQQFRLLAMDKRPERVRDGGAKKLDAPVDRYNNYSGTSNQQDTFEHFTKDLATHAEKARGRQKPPTSTPGTSKSGGTLNTVSALMPFRTEFEMAGLAVTSKDQTKRIPSYITKAVAARPAKITRPTPQEHNAKASQFDGFDDDDQSSSPNTEISFTHPKDMDEWRFALVDEDPAVAKHRKKKDKKAKQRSAATKKSKARCIPCFLGSPSLSPDTDWAHFRPPRTSKVPALQSGIGPPPPMPPPAMPPPRPPRPAMGLFDPLPPPAAKVSPKREAAPLQAPSHTISPRMLPPRKASNRNKPKKSVADSKRQTRQGSPSGKSAMPLRAAPVAADINIPDPVVSEQYKRPFHSMPNANMHRDASRRSIKAIKSNKNETSNVDAEMNHVGICCRSNRSIPSRANARPNIPRRTSSMQRLIRSSKLDYDDREITDRDVLRGLHIAASAACDEEVDAFVRNKTGLRIRRFLADLMALENLGERRHDENKDEWARRRRAEMRKLKQQMRRSREINNTGGFI